MLEQNAYAQTQETQAVENIDSSSNEETDGQDVADVTNVETSNTEQSSEEDTGEPESQEVTQGAEAESEIVVVETQKATEEAKQEESKAEISGSEEGKEVDEEGAGNIITPLFLIPFGAVDEDHNLITSFEFKFTDTSGQETTVENGENLEVDVDNLNAAMLKYGITKPDEVNIAAGDTYTIELPEFFDGSANNVPITIDGTKVATYSISDGKVIITFNAEVEDFDGVEMYVDLQGNFDTEVFKDVEEVVVEVPFSEEASYTATIKAEKQEYDGEDKKTAGNPYVIEDGKKVPVSKNPTHVDWTVRANDNMSSFESATIIDDLGENLEIVEGSFEVNRIIRNHNNVEIGRELVSVIPTITDNGFEIKLGAINDAYEITYTTELIRPDGGGQKYINNSARIILDGNTTNVSDNVSGSWSGDLPAITKEGKLSDNPHIINWEVEYNYGKENLGEVTLTDTLTHGEVDLESVKVWEVDTDIDGNVVGERTPVEITPVKTETGMNLRGLVADGKAYLITFSSSVPVGLNDTVINTISDNLDVPNSDNASVPVNTIPTGGKVGEQKVDDEGMPYIEWTITMNSNKINVPSITVRDVFSQEHLTFDVEDTNLYELYKDDTKVDNFTIEDYTHTDNRTGFKLDISNAGPHTYKFVYRTYYTTLGMQQEELANHAELVFLDGDGEGIGDGTGKPLPPLDIKLEGPNAGITKSGGYVLNETNGLQEIEWTVTFNQSKILLNSGSTITDEFTSENYTFINGSLTLTKADESTVNHNLKVDEDNKGFVITLTEATNATIMLKFRTTADDTNNLKHDNKAKLTWQGGEETATHTVGKRDPGSNKMGAVVINTDGTKTINWTINFNTNKNVIYSFKLVDSYTPTTVKVSDIKITSGSGENKTDVTTLFTISEEKTGGTFTVEKARLDAVQYQLTYSTTLSPEEEQQEIKNTAAISYTGGSENPEKTIPSPTLGVEKQAKGITRKNDEMDYPVISWIIQANTDSANKHVNLVDAVLEDTIPLDQKLVQDSIKVYRTDKPTEAIEGLTIEKAHNSFSIELPDGPYQYKVTFDTEILQMPSVDPDGVFDRYNNSTTLKNQTKAEDENLKKEVSASANISYYKDVKNDLTGKTGVQNSDTENIDYEVTINPEGLTIHNAVVKDTLSNNHQYVAQVDSKGNALPIKDSIVITDSGNNKLTEGIDYVITVAENKQSFEISFKIGSNETGTIDSAYSISYSTRLNPNLVGTYNVTNSIILTGGTNDTKLDETKTTTRAQQWFYGGGGSGRLLDFDIKKEKPNGNALEGVKFKLERVNLDGSSTTIENEIVTGSSLYNIIKQRAGRYILTEIFTPDGYQAIQNPIYFAVGYSEPGSEYPYTITIMNSAWKPATHPNATAEGNILKVVNNFEPVKQGFEATKKLTGLDLTAGQFSFDLLDGNSEVVATASNDAEGNITFAEQSFSQPGTYNFKISEVNEGLGGINYDTSELNVQVIIIEGSKGLEVKSVSYLDGKEFENTYTPAPVNAVIEASKKLDGLTLTEVQFEFELLDSQGEVLQTVTNKADGSIAFEAINYDEVGEYDYTIQEATGNLGGITYDESVFTVTVIITDDKEGQLQSAVNYIDGPVQFTNTYTAGPGSIVLEAQKILNGQELKNVQFEFELVDENEEIIQTVTNNASGQVIFDEIEFDEVGTFEYTIREKAGTLGGITYDSKVYGITVTVVDGGKGHLIATAVYDNGPAVFTNKYEAAPGGIVLEATKRLEGQELIEDQFAFTLTDGTGEVIQTKTNNANGQIIFDEITYDSVGSYSYIISEALGVQGGITYDNKEHFVTVNVSDNGEGKLVAEANYIRGPVEFNNKYTPNPDSIVLVASKKLEGQDLRDGQFTFELVDENEDVIQTVTNNTNGQVIFDEITYETGGEYKYTIREVKGSQGGMTYDETVYEVVVTVADDREATLTAEAVYINGPAEFKNTYTPDPDSIVLEANKILEGQELRDGQFTFELVEENEEDEEVIQTVTNNANGQVIFDEITYETAGEHKYSIREVKGSQGGMAYDETVYEVVVTVSDDGEGTLTAEAEYINGTAEFNNIYTPDPDSVVIEADKTLEGQDLRNGQFTFELLNSEGKVLQTKENNSNGQIIFDEIIYEVGGTHEYTIREVEGVQGGVTYDTTEYKVEVTVTDDGVGTLTAAVEYVDGPITFNNKYEADPESVVFEGSKALEGQDLREKQFTFELVDSEGNVLETVTNNGKGQIIFSEITYEEIGEHSYTIREVEGSQGGVTYDDTTYEVIVTVTDDGEGSLVAEVEYVGGPVVFNNIYTPDADSVVFEASKTLKGQDLREGQFTFELLDEKGKILQTKKNNANGQIIFDELNFEEAGTYKYTIHEVAGNQKGISYDSSKFNITVEVVDDGNGSLTASAEYVDGSAEFVNTYEDPSKDTDGGKVDKPGDKDPDSTSKTDKTDTPKTGDNSPILGYSLLLVLALSSIIFIIYKYKKEKRESIK